MSIPQVPPNVKLIMSLIFSRECEKNDVLYELEDKFGVIDFISRMFTFNYTSYYEEEMGKGLKRRFISFERLISPDLLPDIKLFTNELEKKYSFKNNRKINIDPGYLASEKVVLATGKNYSHRPYLRDGIYADLTLIYEKGSFISLRWTYPDYKESKTIEIFNNIRKRYIFQISGKVRC
jgi:hypothetical protein